jgi:hypothetical protein
MAIMRRGIAAPPSTPPAGDAGNATNTSVLNATVTNNVISNPGATSRHGIVFNIGAGTAMVRPPTTPSSTSMATSTWRESNGAHLSASRTRSVNVKVTPGGANRGERRADDANGFMTRHADLQFRRADLQRW